MSGAGVGNYLRLDSDLKVGILMRSITTRVLRGAIAVGTTGILTMSIGVTSAQARIGAPSLQYGSTGRGVQCVQRAVGVAVDGVYGSNTRTAVRNFQANHNLTVDGIVGPNTGDDIWNFDSHTSGYADCYQYLPTTF
jgi:peptidoglycan hydrolase-like protein with peptidoglycan-binding domain